jgi:hypothetical protein
MWLANWRNATPGFSSQTNMVLGLAMAEISDTRPTRTGAILRSSTNTSTQTRVAAAAPATRPVGPRLLSAAWKASSNQRTWHDWNLKHQPLI